MYLQIRYITTKIGIGLKYLLVYYWNNYLYSIRQCIENVGKGKGKIWKNLTATIEGYFQFQKVILSSRTRLKEKWENAEQCKKMTVMEVKFKKMNTKIISIKWLQMQMYACIQMGKHRKRTYKGKLFLRVT